MNNPQNVKLEYKELKISDIPNGAGIVVDIYPEGRLISVIITRRGSQINGFHNICSHAGWRLENDDGKLLFDDVGDLICSGHCAAFSAKDGTFLGGPGKGKPLRKYPLVIEGETIIIR